MPELRSRTTKVIEKSSTKEKKKPMSKGKRIKQTIVAKDDDVTSRLLRTRIQCISHLCFLLAFKEFPKTPEERSTFINCKTNRVITPFHYQVYDLCAQVQWHWKGRYEWIFIIVALDTSWSSFHLQGYQWCIEISPTCSRSSITIESLLSITYTLSSSDCYEFGYWWIQWWMGWLSICGRQESQVG